MENTKNTYQRLLEAKKQIGSTTIKKKGRNAFSKYDYFTPSQITNLVLTACIDNGLIGTASIDTETLDNGSTKYRGIYTLVNVDNPEQYPLQFHLPTELPELKATNAAQKLGGMMTYVNRYLQMLAFDISEDALDLDDKDGTKKASKPTPKQKIKITDEQFKAICDGLSSGNVKYTPESIIKAYNLDTEQIEQIRGFISTNKS